MSDQAQDFADEDDVTKAVELAKSYIRKLYKTEQIVNLGLEEVAERDGSVWDITLGFSRPWDADRSPYASALAVVQGQTSPKRRTYKVVRVNTEHNRVTSVTNRDV